MNEIDYKKEYELLHSKGHYRGYSVLRHKGKILNIIKSTKSSTILDYGSGKGMQYSKFKMDKFWNVSVDCYDPYVEKLSVLPEKKYDGVICTDVLEHIPEEQLDETLNIIFSKATKFVFFCIHIDEAVKTFSDGQNVHVTIKPVEFWTDIVNKHNTNNLKLGLTFRTK